MELGGTVHDAHRHAQPVEEAVRRGEGGLVHAVRVHHDLMEAGRQVDGGVVDRLAALGQHVVDARDGRGVARGHAVEAAVVADEARRTGLVGLLHEHARRGPRRVGVLDELVLEQHVEQVREALALERRHGVRLVVDWLRVAGVDAVVDAGDGGRADWILREHLDVLHDEFDELLSAAGVTGRADLDGLEHALLALGSGLLRLLDLDGRSVARDSVRVAGFLAGLVVAGSDVGSVDLQSAWLREGLGGTPMVLKSPITSVWRRSTQPACRARSARAAGVRAVCRGGNRERWRGQSPLPAAGPARNPPPCPAAG